MIIFTVTNKVTKQVYVGSTRNDLESQWEKMVAAALQDMDYPLYREIRVQGEENFTVEEWDRAESREELSELEQDALDFFNARSLKGYKTSTVKILPRKKQRQRKSSFEDELSSIFDELNDSDEAAPSLTIKQKTAEAAPEKTAFQTRAPQASTAKATVEKSTVAPTLIDVKARLEQLAREEERRKAEEKAAAAALKAQQMAGSRANAMVQMKDIELSDDIMAQLAAITAAADACLAGDASAAAQLSQHIAEEVSVAPKEATAPLGAEQPSEPEQIEEEVKEEIVEAPVCLKTLRIREAIERHRKQRTQQTTEARESYKNGSSGITVGKNEYILR